MADSHPHSHSQNAPDDTTGTDQFSLIGYLNELVGAPPNIHPNWVRFVNNVWSNLRLAVLNHCDTFGFTPNDGLCYFKTECGTPRLVGNHKFFIGMENYPELQEVLRHCIEQNPQLGPFFLLTTLTEDRILYTIELAKIPPPLSNLELLLDTLNYVGTDRNYKRIEKLAYLTENAVFEQILTVLESGLPTNHAEVGLPEQVTITSSQRAKAARAIIKSYLLLQNPEPDRLPAVTRALGAVLAQDELPLARARAATALGSIKQAEVLALLLPALDDSAALVRVSAVQAIAHACDKTNANPVFVPDERPVPHPTFANKYPYRVAAWSEFALIPQELVVEKLARLLVEDSSAPVRLEVAKAFGKLKNETEPVVNSLLRACEHDNENSVRVEAMDTLASLKAVQVYPLALCLVEDTNEVIELRCAAVYALGLTGVPQALDKVSQILLNLDRLIPPIPGAIAGDGKVETDVETEIEVEADNGQGIFCKKAVTGLHYFGEAAVKTLTELLGSPSLSLQATITVARWLGSFSSRTAVEPLMKLLEHPDYRVRAAAAGSFNWIAYLLEREKPRDKKLTAALLKQAQYDPSPLARYHAIWGLNGLRSKGVLTIFRQMLAEEGTLLTPRIRELLQSRLVR